MRPLISYDDLTDVMAQGDSTNSASPPKKRRKPNRNSNRKSGGSSEAHTQVLRNAAPKTSKSRNGIQQQERYLTHEEIWDDSALVEAWNAAAEEYEVLNGPDKQWKTERVNKSALWYNIPPKQKDADESNAFSTGMPSIPAEFAVHFESSAEMEDVQETEEDQENSRPIDFDTFVPQHDPSLPSGQGIYENTFARVVPSPPKTLSSVSADQAFQNAMGAWYWAGYWTGIYHATSKTKPKADVHQDDNDGDNENEIEDQGDEIENTVHSPEVIITDETDLIPT